MKKFFQMILAALLIAAPSADARRGDRLIRINLAWSPNPAEDNVAVYTIYWYREGGPSFARDVTTTNEAIAISPIGTYHITVSATNQDGLESAESAEVRVVDGVPLQ